MAEIYQVQDGRGRRDAPVMIRVIRICRNCVAKIFSDAPEGLCIGCVLEAAVRFLPDAVAGGGPSAVSSAKADDPGHADKPASAKKARSVELRGAVGDHELLEEA